MPNPNPATTLTIPDITNLDNLTAAFAYANAGWYIGPVKPGTKHPGSILGKNWQSATTRDPETIADYWLDNPTAGIFLHVGRSGAIVLDVDTPSNLPDLLITALADTPAPFQFTRRNDLARRHYVYTQPAGRTLGNGLGSLPAGWGDLRGANGVIIVAPSEHPDPEGHYTWGRTGEVPELPTTIAEKLTDTTRPVDVATDSTIRAFIRAHTTGENHNQIDAWVATYHRYVREGDSRHQRATSILTGALKEAAAGYFPAATAEKALREAFLTTVTTPGASPKQGDARTPVQAVEEWRGILAWAVAQAEAANPDTTVERAEAHAPTIPLTTYTTNEEGARELVNTATGEIEPIPDTEPETGTDQNTHEQDQTSDLDQLFNPNATPDTPPSWAPIDLTPILNGTWQRPHPTLLTRTDGPALLYPGKIHTVFGESESGKSWVAQHASARTLTNGGTVTYIDFESDALDIIDRLTNLGATPDILGSGRFAYIQPDASPLLFNEQTAFAELLATPRDLVILDGVTEALGIHGKSSLDNDEITAWMRQVPRAIAKTTGAAVILIDHVVKSTLDRGRFPIGGQAKMAAIDGAAYLIEPTSALGAGLAGELTIRVAKDRPGAVRAHAGDWRKTDRTQEAARFTLDSTSDTLVAELQPPLGGALADRPDTPKKPTFVMEKISRILTTEKREISQNEVVSLYKEDGSKTRRATIIEALNLLSSDGYVFETEGARGARMFRACGTYLSRNDRDSSDYVGELEEFETG